MVTAMMEQAMMTAMTAAAGINFAAGRFANRRTNRCTYWLASRSAAAAMSAMAEVAMTAMMTMMTATAAAGIVTASRSNVAAAAWNCNFAAAAADVATASRSGSAAAAAAMVMEQACLGRRRRKEQRGSYESRCKHTN